MADNQWDIGLGLTLKSNALANIQSEINSVQNQLKPIEIGINTKQVQTQLNNIKNQIQGLSRIKIDLGGIGSSGSGTKKTSNELAQLKNQIEQFTTMQKRIGNLRLKIAGLEQAGQETKNLRAMLEGLETTYDNLWHTFQKKIRTSDLVTGDFKKISNDAVELEHKMDMLKAAYEDTRATMAKDIQSVSSMSKMSAQITDLEAKFKKLGISEEEVAIQLKPLQDLMTRMDSSDDIESVIQDYNSFKQTLFETTNAYKELQRSSQSEAATSKLNQDKVALLRQIDLWLTQNSAATKQFGTEFESLKSKIRAADATSLSGLKGEFQDLIVKANQAGVATQSFGDKLKAQLSKLGVYFSATILITKTIQTIKNMVNTVVELDTALIDLKKTTTASDTELQKFYYSANTTAKQLGVTTQSVIQAAADWSRLGFAIKDAQEMAKTSSIFTSISPDLDINEATDGLVSAMKAFKIEADDALDGVASKINIIGNTQAVSNGNIVDFLTRSSSAMAEANNTLDETIALGTAITEITRDAANAGQVMKTASMRIRGYDEDTEELSEDVMELTGKIADLTKTASKPSGISLFTDSAKTQYKSTVQILREISEIYDELTDKQQAQLLEALGGKRGGQAIAAALNNWDAVESSLESMQHSAGNAMKEMETIEQSLEYRLNALKETAVGTFQNMLSQKDAAIIFEFLTGLLNVIDSLTSSLGLFGTAIVGIEIAAFIKNFD